MKYGSYETIKGLATQDGKAVFLAGDKTSEGYVAKVYYIEHYAGNDPKKLEKFNESFYSRVEAQKKAALGSQYVAPIIQFGQDDASAWYVTRLYQSSVDKLLASKVTLDAESLYHVLYSVVRGALDLKKICGRSHGNLLPGNILFSTPGKIIKPGQVVLTDPTAGDAAQSDEIELADLRAIGELVYRLIYPHETRDIDLQKVPVMPTSQRWVGLFGGNAEAWFNIFNKLLNRKLSLKDYTLEELESDLLKVRPRTSTAPKPKVFAIAAAGLVIIGGITWSFMSGKNPSSLPASSTPAQTGSAASAEETVSEEEVQKRATEAKAAEARRAEEARQLAVQKAAEEKAQEEARLKAEAEALAREEERKAEAAQLALEQKRQAEANAAAETQRQLEGAAAKAVAQEREQIRKEADARRIEDERKARELAAELERREKERQEATRKAAEAERLRKEAEARRIEEERKTRELSAELARREKEKEEAARKAAEAERLRREAEARQRELAAKLERERRENQAQAQQIAALRENPAVGQTIAVANPAAPLVAENDSPNVPKPRPDQRWSNSLGMKFAPAGKILCCVWETRRKDYEEFVRTARYDVNNAWKSVSFKQAASHPVVNVNWNEASAFCRWLTETERKKGLIGDTQFYRLPTDAEWTFVNSSGNGTALFIWGNAWPPPAGVGNFALTFSYDRFDYTAPVAQFQSNRGGFFDLIGNVWEMCEESRDNPVARGGSWLTALSDQLQLSYRLPLTPTDRREDVGFRIVLDLGE